MIVYKVTCKISNLSYIGQTIRPLEKRWKEHIYDATVRNIDSFFYNAIRKYGPENFTIEEIDGANSQSELNYKEWLYVHNIKTLSPNGYNSIEGGGSKGKSSNKLKEKISSRMTGRKHSKKTINKMKNTWSNNTLIEKQRTSMEYMWSNNEYKERLSKSQKKSWKDKARQDNHKKALNSEEYKIKHQIKKAQKYFVLNLTSHS